jgi:peptidoglycan/xylan/chitin deacetylase (PgdA/CDA1 family)
MKNDSITNTDTLYFKVRSLLREGVLDVLGIFSTPAPGIHILNGHRIQDEAEPETFRRLLTALSKQVKFVRVEDAVQMIIQREHPTEPLVAFTFDDGFMECYDIFAPVLEDFGINALFFVNPNYVDGDKQYIDHFNHHIVMTPGKLPMRWSHLKALHDRGHIIGAHTMDHYMISNGDQETLHHQIVDCKTAIENHINGLCDYFAFPYGKLTQANEQSIKIACATYKYVFSQSDYKHYFSFNNTVINRRHFEPFWPVGHLKYFLSCKKQ